MTAIAGSLVAAIESVWANLRARYPDIPDVVVTMAAGSVGRRGLKLGHFGPDRWKHGQQVLPELFVGGEGLAFGARDVLGTLLHEAAHGIAQTRGVTDTSRAGAYHNKKFRDIAQELGLTVTRDNQRGWSGTVVPDATAARHEREIAALAAAIVAHRRSEHQPAGGNGDDGDGGDENGEKAARNGRALVCMCSPVRRVRAHKKTIDAGPILCGVCQEPFTAPDDEQDRGSENGRG
ncbi:hypothetical protein [Nocardia wallacei]|uniref:SprT-like domain-containing protein n=1 Tax=Nocardia wallacei TaxID=480035 RepID=A0A7G1KR96_9NOCA|nr:hypothetical protein [Nocardia wallacei]BCK57391.1 hypothetical protein NWFMUON74_51630 [Nocardia wallacei]